MSALSVTIDYRQIASAAGGFRLAATLIKDQTLLTAGAKVLVTMIAAEAPVGKDQYDYAGNLTHSGGTLRASITWKTTGSQGAGVYGASYGPWVVHGTRPHEIRPRYKKVLHWGGKPGVSALVVAHPGTKPNDFVKRGVERATPALKVLMLANGRRLVNIMSSRA